MFTPSRTLYLTLASSIAAAMIVLALVFSSPFALRPNLAEAQTAEALLKAYAAKDTDADGLPDWQESLYGTDPVNPESAQPGVKDGDAVAQGLVKLRFESDTSGLADDAIVPGEQVKDDTLTAKFAREFFTNYITTYGNAADVSDTQLEAFTKSTVESLVASNKKAPAYAAGSITLAGAGREALRAYAVRAETAFSMNTIPSDKSELAYMDDALQRNDAGALASVRKIGKAYAAIGKAYAAVSVPSEAAAAHLRIANALVNLGEVITDMGAADTDPVRGLLGLTLYTDAASELSDAFQDLSAVFRADGLVLAEDEPGYAIYKAALQASTLTTGS